MKRVFPIISLVLTLIACSNGSKNSAAVEAVGSVPAFEKGMEQGVSACYVTLHDGCMYIAGGCNFPEVPAADGGEKRYYKGVYRAVLGDTLVWDKVAELPIESAYGAYASEAGKWYIAGGMNSKGALKSVYCINVADGCRVDTLASLPYSVDNCAAAVAEGHLFVVGGNCSGEASNRVFSLNLADAAAEWQELPSMPSRARVQPVCAATQHTLFVWGGFSPANKDSDVLVHTDGCSYNIAQGKWSTLADVSVNGEIITLSGGTATTLNGYNIIAAGGVNREIFTDAVSGRYNLIPKDKYMLQAPEWYNFNNKLLQYNVDSNEWSLMCCNKSFARAGAAIVTDKDNIYYVGGELKPGIRTRYIHRVKNSD
ncbi:MAG: cyclically-permuted mutarotase family protein [Bacteroidaceae bacterium]|nr:cyclically-permuted mutarotase family protein [Bacteroidaceae bacterium]